MIDFRHYLHLWVCLLAGYLSLASVAAGYAQGHRSGSPYLRQLYQQKYERWLRGHPDVDNHIAITDQGVSLYASAVDKKEERAEYTVRWDELVVFQTLIKQNPLQAYELFERRKSVETVLQTLKKAPLPRWQDDSDQPLAGFRIALDPGHVAHDMATAMMEGKFIQMFIKDVGQIAFYEAELTLATARIVQEKLERLGATVMLTREYPSETAFGITFEQWYEQYLKRAEKEGVNIAKLNKQRVFYKEFLTEEMRQRAFNINAFQPHMTLMIHYNVEGSNKPWNKPTQSNANMAFIGGAFLKGELEKERDRFHLLRMLLSEDLERSIDFSRQVMYFLGTKLNVLPLQIRFKNTLGTGVPGLYARNLSLTRLVYGPLCYGESLYQDNYEEAIALNQKDVRIAGVQTSKRVVQVAEAYFEAIVQYAKTME
ncbi:N-acetylmuramoyl-L-alanine amidase [Eisenibacter elegans]|jgi:N-acetylmuramoyl-L-alanine amidase|uniref:N-acetylmuramoyl-L-alanine amidase n=1 Tax=Eisenibacter elegans TaxID=997 RepID=UPI0004116B74|nr:N-acetylmuramoyl-L-alanine amidase [Eisenibacter elegans]